MFEFEEMCKTFEKMSNGERKLYLQEQSVKMINAFETLGSDGIEMFLYFMAVACGAIISRYLFLREIDKLSDMVHVPLPKGAGPEVDKVGEELVEKYGEEKLKEVAKLNFKNTDRILHTMIF